MSHIVGAGSPRGIGSGADRSFGQLLNATSRYRAIVRVLRPLVFALLVGAAVVGLARPADAAVAPLTWCGADEVSANRVPNLQVSSSHQIRVVYAIPSDGADNFAQDASAIATDIASIDEWWRGQDPTRTPRFDLYPFPGCTTTFGDLDLGFVRTTSPGATYLGTSNVNIAQLANQIGVSTSQAVKTLVYYNGPVVDPYICGTSFTWPMLGDGLGMSFLFLQANCFSDLGQGGALARVALHELIHNLGAVPDAAPNDCPPPDGGHVCDTSTDIMYPYTYDGETLGTAVLDVNRDDYYGHSGSWWDVQDSPWLVHLPQFSLSAAAKGPGKVAGVPGVAACAPACSATLDSDLTVLLVARPAAGSVFLGWRGTCKGTGACEVAMNGPKSAVAVFGPKPKPKAKPKPKPKKR
jgi:hypothetical protein